jgi:pimeloyl-ACP methyl ester carboxylesterase
VNTFRLATPDGHELSLRGTTDAPIQAFFVHGLGDGGFIWQTLVGEAEWNTSYLALDLRGHGDSSWDRDSRYRQPQHGADVAFVLQQLPAPKITLIGHSLGADIAIRAAAASPACVKQLVIIDGGPQARAEGGMAIVDALRTQPRCFSSIAEYAQLLKRRSPLAQQAVLEEIATASLRASGPHWYALKYDPALLNAVTPPDTVALNELLGTLHCPVYIVRGARSAVLSAEGAALTAARTRSANITCVPGAGHAVMLDNPRALRSLLLGICRAS